MTVERTCVGCGARDDKRSMHRLVRADARLEIDASQCRNGRGAYLHRAPSCIAAFAGRRGGLRSLRWTPPVVERARVAAALTAGAGSVR